MRLQRLADALFGAGVDGGGRIVEHQDGGAKNGGARNRYSLPLAARQTHAALADQRAVAVRQLADETVDLGQFGGAVNRVVIGPGVAVSDIVFQRSGEQKGVLLNHPHGAAQRFQRHIADILAIQRDAAAAGVVITRQQMGDGRFAAAGRADDAERLAPRHAKRHAVQHRRRAFAGIGEGNVVKFNPAIRKVQGRRPRPVADGRLAVKHGEQPRAAGRGACDRVDDHAKLPHRQLQYRDEGQEDGQRTDAHRPVDHPQSAGPQHQSHGDEIGEGHGGDRVDPGLDASLGDRHRLGGGAVVFSQLEGFGAERADHADPGQVLVHQLSQRRHPVLQRQPQPAQLEPGDRRAPGDERHEAQTQQAEHKIGRQQ